MDDLKREITNLKVPNLLDLRAFRFAMDGSETKHFISYDEGDWNCDCMGFIVRKECRHTKAGQIILFHLKQIKDEVIIKQ